MLLNSSQIFTILLLLLLLLLLMLLKTVGSTMLGESDKHSICPKTPDPQYQPKE